MCFVCGATQSFVPAYHNGMRLLGDFDGFLSLSPNGYPADSTEKGAVDGPAGFGTYAQMDEVLELLTGAADVPRADGSDGGAAVDFLPQATSEPFTSENPADVDAYSISVPLDDWVF
ncbi:MAG: hypothetical protein QNJ09_08075 [Paracoccaceae bacterium]|nr:hypothetical protein [Paracoccaceae bacterium]